MTLKFDVTIIFLQLHVLLEKKFEFKITHLYSDNGGEYISLKPYLNKHGINHLTTPPPPPTLLNTMLYLNIDIVKLLKQEWHYLPKQIYPKNSGVLPFKQ
jgi:hypothetical protein